MPSRSVSNQHGHAEATENRFEQPSAAVGGLDSAGSMRFTSIVLRVVNPSWKTLAFCAAGAVSMGSLISVAPAVGLLVLAAALLWFGFLSPGGLLLLTAASVPTIALIVPGDTVLSRVTAFVALGGVFAAVTLIKGGASELGRDRRLAAVVWPLVALATLATFTTLLSLVDPDARVRYAFPNSDAARLTVIGAQVGILAFTAALPLCCYRVMLADRVRRAVLNLLISLGVMLAILAIASFILGTGRAQIDNVLRPAIGSMSANAVGLILITLLPIPLSRLLVSDSAGDRLLLAVPTVVIGLGAAVAFSRITWIAEYVEVFAVLLAFARGRALYFGLVTLFMFLGVFAIFPAALAVVAKFYDPAQTYGFERLDIGRDAIAIYLTHPVFGVGAGNYQFFDRSIPLSVSGAGVAHNQYLTLLAEDGPLAVAILGFLLVGIGRAVFSMLTANDAPTRSAGLMLMGSTIGMGVSGLAGDTFSISASLAGGTIGLTVTGLYWILVGGTLAAARRSSSGTVGHESAYLLVQTSRVNSGDWETASSPAVDMADHPMRTV